MHVLQQIERDDRRYARDSGGWHSRDIATDQDRTLMLAAMLATHDDFKHNKER